MATTKKAWSTREKLDRENSVTRARLLRAARSVFERRGYARTTVADITAAAEVSRATFYVYFASKEDVFAVLAAEVRDGFLNAQELTGLDADDPHAVARATVSAYLDAYVEHLAFITVLQHQAITDPDMYALWEAIHSHPRRRTVRYIEQATAAGLAAPVAPPEVVATASGGMIAAFAPAVANDPADRDEIVSHLVTMYLGLLGITPEAPSVA
ncbi:TetR/AcrR family transcriptional regulator [Streptomyces sp. MB22_4]|uniref:TetR/AcrR family transcriptional regulator n=1 Tax=Streptomyces sp. MB22_4 TaxID=3383120 RepID=UPI0039A05FD3